MPRYVICPATFQLEYLKRIDANSVAEAFVLYREIPSINRWFMRTVDIQPRLFVFDPMADEPPHMILLHDDALHLKAIREAFKRTGKIQRE